MLQTKLSFPIHQGILLIQEKNISHFQSNDNYCTLFNTKGRAYFINKSLKWIEEIYVAHSFFLVHNCYKVNMNQVLQFKKLGAGLLILDSGFDIPISRNKKKEVYELLLSQITSNPDL